MTTVFTRIVELIGWIVFGISALLLVIAHHIDNYQSPPPADVVHTKYLRVKTVTRLATVQPVSETGCTYARAFITLPLSSDRELFHGRFSAQFLMGCRYRSVSG